MEVISEPKSPIEKTKPSKEVKSKPRQSPRKPKKRPRPVRTRKPPRLTKRKRTSRRSHKNDVDESDAHLSSASSSPPTPPPEREQESHDEEDIQHEEEKKTSDNDELVEESIRVKNPEEVAVEIEKKNGIIADDDDNDNHNTIIKYNRMSTEAWLQLLIEIFKTTKKQKTIRELATLIKDRYPVFKKAPPVWESDFAEVLESNPQFQNMGRGRWCIAHEENDEAVRREGKREERNTFAKDIRLEERDEIHGTSSTEEEDWRSLGPQKLISSKRRRHSVAGGPIRRNSISTQRKSRKKTKSVSYQSSEKPNLSTITSSDYTSSPIPEHQKTTIMEVPMTPNTPSLSSNLQLGFDQIYETPTSNSITNDSLLSPVTPTPQARRYEFITETIRPTSPTPRPKLRTPKTTPPPPNLIAAEFDYPSRFINERENDRIENNLYQPNQFPIYQQHPSRSPSHPSPQSNNIISLSSIPVIPEERAAIEALTLLCRTEASPL
ncbi:2277_t:CDS:1 [Ambispora leptoticha]|uniref:2277_t:CDS:1 n=1 Tax=Ambispora leptoticha TaxID=144679 RepID=A0A9N9A6S3_9GLOM|nr:2277_t:CDS:1 [Ambispora leptoticha]